MKMFKLNCCFYLFVVLDASVRQHVSVLPRCFSCLGVISDTTICDLCHVVTPKVVGFLAPVPLVIFVPTIPCLFFNDLNHFSSYIFRNIISFHLIDETLCFRTSKRSGNQKWNYQDERSVP